MKKLSIKELVIYISVIALGIGLDQLIKYLALKFVQPAGTIPVIKGIFHLTYTENPGMAFGLLSDARWVFISVSSVAIIGLAVFLFIGKSPNLLYGISIAMIVSGGLGNMIDRFGFGFALQAGRVVDMFEFAFIDFAIFNFADTLVCVGAGLLILALILDIVKEARAGKQ
ncbi:MAG: signal peptidase II [Clostridia bacterium]|nr:signal peptidase II [Clostridia bacterium]